MKVGIIGLGRMGTPMARNIAKGGHALFVNDIRLEAAVALAAETGATSLPSAAAVAAASEILLTSLPGPKEVEATMTGAGGILEGIGSGTILLATSTVGAEQSRRHADLLAAKGAIHLDSPVSGGVEGAVAGTLTVMVGGDADAYSRARPVLDRIGTDVHHLGPAGAGNDMKLIIQMVFGSYLSVFLEGVAFGQEMGIPTALMLKILGTSSAHHPSIGKRYDKIIAGDTSPRSPVSLFEKDLALVHERTAGAGFDASVLAATSARFSRAVAEGLGERDVIALIETYRNKT